MTRDLTQAKKYPSGCVAMTMIGKLSKENPDLTYEVEKIKRNWWVITVYEKITRKTDEWLGYY